MKLKKLFPIFFTFSIFVTACGEKKDPMLAETETSANIQDDFPELDLQASVPSWDAGGIKTVDVREGNLEMRYALDQNGSVVRASIHNSGEETYEFVFTPEGSAGLCLIYRDNKTFWAPLRDERPAAYLEKNASGMFESREISLDSLAEVVLSYRMDLVVNEP